MSMETWDRRKTVWLVVSLGITAVAATWWAGLARQPKVADVDQIRGLLAQGERALEQRQVSAAMHVVSRDYRDESGNRYPTLRALAGRQMRYLDSIDITLPDRRMRIDIAPDGKHANAYAWVDLRAETRSGEVHNLSSVITFAFVKEPVRYYLLFPSAEWRLVKMEGWQQLISD
jgi:hypothetical protein